MFERIEVVEDIVIVETLPKAGGIMDGIDKDDTKFIALALAIENEGIYNDDKHFMMQKFVGVFITRNLIKLVD
ncbi:MAG: PIN domain-containing protein [Candidatus Marsarchaeota archaeon]|nr:PIN domain-containing protein [Candidatus Marsarchaeota archaeon]